MKGGLGLRLLAVLGVVLVVSLIAGVYAAGRPVPQLTAAEAAAFAQRAFVDSGAREVEVRGEPRAEEFTPAPEEGIPQRGPMSVWIVPLTVSGQPVELYVTRMGGQAAYLNDALPDGGFVIDEEQFSRLDRFRLDLAGDRVRSQRGGPATVAGLLILVVSVVLVVSAIKGRGASATPDEA